MRDLFTEQLQNLTTCIQRNIKVENFLAMLEDNNKKSICVKFVLEAFSIGSDLNKGAGGKDICMSTKIGNVRV